MEKICRSLKAFEDNLFKDLAMKNSIARIFFEYSRNISGKCRGSRKYEIEGRRLLKRATMFIVV